MKIRNFFKRWKKTKITVIILLFLFIASLIVPSIIIQSIVPEVASDMLDTKVEIGSASLNIYAGSIRIKNLEIYNPEGYASPDALSIKEFYANIAVWSLFSKKIVIEDVLIDGMHASLEFKNAMRDNNLNTLIKSVKKEEKEAIEDKAEKSNTTPDEVKKNSKKFVIRKFIFKNSSFLLQTVDIPLPYIELTDVGNDKSITEVSSVFLGTITKVIVEGSKNIANSVKGSLDNISKSVNDTLQQTTNETKDASKDLINNFKKLF